MTLDSKGTALSATARMANTLPMKQVLQFKVTENKKKKTTSKQNVLSLPLSSKDTTFEVMDRRTGATVGPSEDTTAPDERSCALSRMLCTI